MQIDDVLVFLQIASTGSLSAAARAAYKPKATISHQLRRLEEELGTELFTRSANKLVLNDAGLSFLDHAKNIRRACERGIDAARRSRNITFGTLRVASSGEFSSNLVGPLVLHFARHHPQLRLEVMVLRGDALLRSRDSLDCILYLGEPPMPQVAELTARLLGRFSFGLYASPSYLARNGVPQSPSELRTHELIGFHNGESTTLWELKDGEREFSLHPSTKFLTNDYWVLKLAAIHDHGIAFMPTFFASLEVANSLLTPVLPEWRSPEVPMYALFASHRMANPNLRTLIDSVSQNFQEIFDYDYYACRNDALTNSDNRLERV
ncbi:LysR family transcriptional regulator [Mesorhizobium xinjiangense]|uniref:LysR family transcriptional regulator n=1 Tax=Mesorhizobium xinjiangense TaxID=2678685 RepID=UPI0012EE6795|nr:LysR family transcriptional regulator [Mesorhizobium xinjiangense]